MMILTGDVKKQECMYSITQADDGGLVIDGNYSENRDDCYLVKLYNDCDARYLTDLLNVNPSDFYNANSITFTTQTWTSPMTVYGKLIIPSGEKFQLLE